MEVKSIDTYELPSLDDSFASSSGFKGGIPAFREKVVSTMKFELDQAMQFIIKTQIFNVLIEP